MRQNPERSDLVSPVVAGCGLDEAELGALLVLAHQRAVRRCGEAGVRGDRHVDVAALLEYRGQPLEEVLNGLRDGGRADRAAVTRLEGMPENFRVGLDLTDSGPVPA